jgi:hypothetical protein
MTHAEQILQAMASLVSQDGVRSFSRKAVRDRICVTQEVWMAGYTAIFQAMRSDHPGGAPPIGERYRGVFQRVSHREYQLTPYGRHLIQMFTSRG